MNTGPFAALIGSENEDAPGGARGVSLRKRFEERLHGLGGFFGGFLGFDDLYFIQ